MRGVHFWSRMKHVLKASETEFFFLNIPRKIFSNILYILENCDKRERFTLEDPNYGIAEI